MIRLTFEQYFDDVKSGKCVIETDSEVLGDVIEDMEQLLRGSGFFFDGHLDIIHKEEFALPQDPFSTFCEDQLDHPKYNTKEVNDKMFKGSKKGKPTPKGGKKKGC